MLPTAISAALTSVSRGLAALYRMERVWHTHASLPG